MIEIPIQRASIAGAAALTGLASNVPDAYMDGRFNRRIDLQTGYRTGSLLTVPILESQSSLLSLAAAVAGDEKGGAVQNRTNGVIAVLQLINKQPPPPSPSPGDGHSADIPLPPFVSFTAEDETLVSRFVLTCAPAVRDALSSEASALEVATAHEKLISLERDLAQAREAAAVAAQEVSDTAQAAAVAVETEKKRTQIEVESELAAQRAAAKRTLASQRAAAENELVTERASLNARIDAMSTRNQTLERELATLRSTQDALVAEAARTHVEENTQLKAQVAALKGELGTSETRLREVRALHAEERRLWERDREQSAKAERESDERAEELQHSNSRLIAQLTMASSAASVARSGAASALVTPRGEGSAPAAREKEQKEQAGAPLDMEDLTSSSGPAAAAAAGVEEGEDAVEAKRSSRSAGTAKKKKEKALNSKKGKAKKTKAAAEEKKKKKKKRKKTTQKKTTTKKKKQGGVVLRFGPQNSQRHLLMSRIDGGQGLFGSLVESPRGSAAVAVSDKSQKSAGVGKKKHGRGGKSGVGGGKGGKKKMRRSPIATLSASGGGPVTIVVDRRLFTAPGQLGPPPRSRPRVVGGGTGGRASSLAGSSLGGSFSRSNGRLLWGFQPPPPGCGIIS